ncbi:hypothetical protein T492DRAFT_1150283, partial [Pavlovales sp. CCMP2436]
GGRDVFGSCSSCVTDARASLVQPHVGGCSGGSRAVAWIKARASDSRFVTVGGDVFSARLCQSLTCSSGHVFPLAVYELCDGSYSVPL